MDPAMLAFYPRGIRVLLVDDEPKFLKTASMLLELLNFKVSTCSSPSSALKVLSKEDTSKDNVDVVLVDAKKATTCGFDLKAIVEPDLRIPVFCFLSQNHKSCGAEADALLRTLDLASFILKKPLDADDVCSLWRDIAWRKCCLNYIRTGGAGGDVGQGSSSGHLLPPWVGLSPIDDDGDEEERVHFREIRGVRGGRKRKCAVKNPGSPSGSGVPPVPARGKGRQTKNLEQTDVAEQVTADPVAKPPMTKSRSKKAKKNGEGASMPVIPEAMNDVVEPQPPQPKQSLFVQSVLQTLNVPPYNPNIFSDAVERDRSVFSFSGAGNTTAVAPATPPAAFSTPAPTAPAPLPANQAPPAPPVVHHQHQIPPAGNDFAPPPAATTMPISVTDKEATLPKLLLGAFGPFPYQGPLPPHGVQDMFALLGNSATTNKQLPFQKPPTIATGDLFTGVVGDEDITEVADDATHDESGGNYGNTASTLMQSLQLGGVAQEEGDEVAGMIAMYNTSADAHLMVPQQVDDDVEAMYYYNNNNNAPMFYNDNGDESSFVAAYNVNDPEMADGAFDGNSAAFMAPQGFGMEPNVNQLATGDDPAAMFAYEGNEEDYSFPLEALMGTDDMQLYDAGLAGQQGGATEGATVADVDAAGIYLNGEEGGMENWGVEPADGIAMLDDMLMNESGSDMFAHYMNNDRE